MPHLRAELQCAPQVPMGKGDCIGLRRCKTYMYVCMRECALTAVRMRSNANRGTVCNDNWSNANAWVGPCVQLDGCINLPPRTHGVRVPLPHVLSMHMLLFGG